MHFYKKDTSCKKVFCILVSQMDSDQSLEEWEVEKILDKKEQDGQVFYKVLWKGFDLSQATWEPLENLVNIQELLKRFESQWQKHHTANQSQGKSLDKQIVQQYKLEQAPKTRSAKKNTIEAQKKQPKLSKKKGTNQQTEESEEEPMVKKRASKARQLKGDNKGRKIVHKAEVSWNQISLKQKERSDKSTVIKKKLQNYLDNLSAEGRPNHQKQTVKNLKNTCLKLDSQRQKWYEEGGLTQVGIKRMKNAFLQQVNTQNNLTNKDPLITDIFLRQKRYKQCDQMLRTQKQLTLRNIIDRQAGLQVQRRRIKMLQVEQAGLLESTLKNIPSADKICIICKLQMLVRTRFGWIAIGKDEKNKLFMSDVNLLEQDCWRGILKEGTQS